MSAFIQSVANWLTESHAISMPGWGWATLVVTAGVLGFILFISAMNLIGSIVGPFK